LAGSARYAKLFGAYEHLALGNLDDALTDLSGGEPVD
jgi:hypothetical protein